MTPQSTALNESPDGRKNKRRVLVKAGTLKERIDRLKKKLASGGEKMSPEQQRTTRKRIKRAQRSRRTVLKMEARAKAKTKATESKPAEGAPAPTT